MKKTVNANIGGFSFHIDQDAYEKLEKYLGALEKHFGSTEEAKEIIEDIELRVAEMFKEQLENKEVISLGDIDKVIKQMGTPEDIGMEESDSTETEGDSSKRLYRDKDNSIVAGVCSGAAAYFEMDPIWLRAGLVAFTLVGGMGVIVYLILWLIVPPARTTAEKLRMHGRRVNVSNIEKSIKEEMDSVKKNLEELRDEIVGSVKGSKKKVIKSMGENRIAERLRRVLRTLGAIMLIGILITALLGAVLIICTVTGIALPHEAENFVNFMTGSEKTNLIIASSIIGVLAVPLLYLVFKVLRYLFNVKQSFGFIKVVVLTLFICGMGGFIYTGIVIGKDFRFETSEKVNFTIQADDSSELEVEFLDEYNNDKTYDRFQVDDWDMFVRGDTLYVSDISIYTFETETDTAYRIEIIKKASGGTAYHANMNLTQIDIPYSLENGKLTLQRFFKIKSPPYRNQKVIVNVYYPKGSKVKVENYRRMNHRYHSHHYHYSYSY